MQPEDEFTLTITEADRQEAGPFVDPFKCLVATALRRKGFKEIAELITNVKVDGLVYLHEGLGPRDLFACHREKTEAPFYKEEIVGKEITFKLKKS